MRKNSLIKLLSVVWLMILTVSYGVAPQGNYASHDPSRLLPAGPFTLYYCTGDRIEMHYSSDLVTWYAGSPALPNGVPAWAKSMVPANGGNFVWAPDVVFNPKTKLWTMFYAYSSFGSQTSVIGALTTTAITLNSVWTDAGLVVASDSKKNYNAIDPCPIFDSAGNLWMSFGSFWSGIKMVQLNPVTLKPMSAVVAIAGSPGGSDMEASFIWPHGGYYYLFYNEGQCCQGVQSTYHIMISRSKTITGPYVDKKGIGVTSGGGTLWQSTSGHRVGPGQTGITTLDGIDRVTYHFYDANCDGAPRIGIQSVVYGTDGWPAIGTDLAAGTYRIISKSSGLSLGVAGENTAPGTGIDQWTYMKHPFQQWKVASTGDGYYSIQSVGTPEVFHLVGNNAGSGSPVVMNPSSGDTCEKWLIDQTNDGLYRIKAATGNVLEVPNASTTLGTKIWENLWANKNNQKWGFASP